MTKNPASCSLIIGSVTWLWLGALAPAVHAQSYQGIAAAPYAESGVDVFAISGDDSVEHRFQRDPATDFSSFENIGGTATDVAALALADGRFEVFIVDHNQGLWHNRQPGSTTATSDWSGWEQLDNATKQVAVARAASGRVELFEIGADDALWHIGRDADDAGFGPWQRVELMGTQLAAAAADGAGFDVVVIANDGALWQLSFSDSGELNGEPKNIAGDSFDVALVRFPEGGHSLITVGTNNELWEGRSAEGALDFGDWQDLGRSAQHVALTAVDTGLQLFTLSDSGELASAQLTAADGSWSDSQALVTVATQAGPLTSQLTGKARLIIPSLNVDKDVDVQIGLQFSADRTQVEITSFPSVVTPPFDTPFGTTTSTVSLARSSTGALRLADGTLSLPVTLHFDQSLDLPIIQEDGDLTVDLSSDAPDGHALDASTGAITLSGSGKLDGQGTNPLNGMDAQIIVTGKLTPTP